VSTSTVTDMQRASSSNLTAHYARWRDFASTRAVTGLHGIRLEPGEVVRLTRDEVEAHPDWAGFG
jgi:hypothetical protein